MKKVLYSLAVLGIVFTGCEKDEIKITDEITKSYENGLNKMLYFSTLSLKKDTPPENIPQFKCQNHKTYITCDAKDIKHYIFNAKSISIKTNKVYTGKEQGKEQGKIDARLVYEDMVKKGINEEINIKGFMLNDSYKSMLMDFANSSLLDRAYDVSLSFDYAQKNGVLNGKAKVLVDDNLKITIENDVDYKGILEKLSEKQAKFSTTIQKPLFRYEVSNFVPFVSLKDFDLKFSANDISMAIGFLKKLRDSLEMDMEYSYDYKPNKYEMSAKIIKILDDFMNDSSHKFDMKITKKSGIRLDELKKSNQDEAMREKIKKDVIFHINGVDFSKYFLGE